MGLFGSSFGLVWVWFGSGLGLVRVWFEYELSLSWVTEIWPQKLKSVLFAILNQYSFKLLIILYL